MARPTRRARERRQAYPGWRTIHTVITVVAASATIIVTSIVRPVAAYSQLAESVRTNAAATHQLAASVERLDERFERVSALERDVAVLKAKVGVE